MGHKIKVAIVDTGICMKNRYLQNRVTDGIGYFIDDDDYIIQDKNTEDTNGHGTACASVILKEYSETELYIVKILNRIGLTTSEVLVEALKVLLQINVKVINLSLSITDMDYLKELYQVCAELNHQGKIIVCSLMNGRTISYPAAFDCVIGVKGFILESSETFWYQEKYEIQCIMDYNPYLHLTLNNTYQLFGKCNSYAAAKLTGVIAKILSEDSLSFHELQMVLKGKGKRTFWTEEDFEESKRFPSFMNKKYLYTDEVFERVFTVVNHFFKITDDKVLRYHLFHYKIGLNYENCTPLLKQIELEFEISFQYIEISRYDLYSIYSLTALVKKQLSKINDRSILMKG